MRNAIRFKQTNVARQHGELARLKVTQGPDFGAVFVLMGPKATIGRGEENDLVILDLKASRVHAELNSTPSGWIVKDRGSANGILFNGTVVREAKLKINDTITMGETTLEFTTSDVGTQFLVAPPRSSEQIQKEQRRIAEVQGKASAMGYAGPLPGMNPGSTGIAGGGLKKNKAILYGVGAIAVLYLLFGDTDKPKPSSKKKGNSNKEDLATFLPSPDKNKTAETLFKDGFREYLQGNYSRARTQFETVLQIMPGHALATMYLENCNKSVENSVKFHLQSGKKSLQAGKLKEAKAHFERVMRLLFKDQSNPSYIEAKDQLDKVVKEMSGGEF